MRICPDSARLTALREGWLEEGEIQSLREHIEECEACRRMLADLYAVVDILSHETDPVEPPPGGYEELLRATLLMRDRIIPVPAQRAPHWLWRAAAAAALILAALTTFSLIDPRFPSTPTMAEEEDIPDFLIEEHALATEALPFNEGASVILIAQRERR